MSQPDPLHAFDAQQAAQDRFDAPVPTIVRFELYRRAWAEDDPARAARIRDFAERVIAAENVVRKLFSDPHLDAALARLEDYLEADDAPNT